MLGNNISATELSMIGTTCHSKYVVRKMYIHLKGSLKCFRDFNCTAGVFFIIVSSFSFLHVRERNLCIEHMCVHKSRVIPNKPNKPNHTLLSHPILSFSKKPYQTALSYLLFLVMCLKCLFSHCKFMMCAARSRNCGKCSTVCATAPYMH